MNTLDDLSQSSREIEEKIAYSFREKKLLFSAFTHRSFLNEHRNLDLQHNERLEFLGDSVLGILVSEHLYRNLPQTPEGDLSRLRSRLVDASACVSYMQKLQVESYLLLGKGELRNGNRGRESILSDLFEAIIGAIFLDGGIEAARQFLFGLFAKEMKAILESPSKNWKAELQDFTQKHFQHPPTYRLVDTSGPEHQKTFYVEVEVLEEVMGKGSGPSKKEAQQNAAEEALERLRKTTESE